MAAARERLQELQREITCGVCQSYFSEPVTIGCGHSFCRACLSLSWRAGAGAFSCPECRQVPQVKEFPAVNRRLAQLTEVGKELSGQLLQSAEGQSQCATHKQVLKLFCEDDQTALCVRCLQSSEHGAHMLSPVEEAAPKFREKLQHVLSQVEKHFEEAATRLDQEERPAVDSRMITLEYRRLHQFLTEEKSRCHERIRQEQNARQDMICQYRKRLQTVVVDLQEASHQANVDLLQDARQLLARSESVLSQRAEAVSPEMREYPIPGMIEMLNRFRVDITMDPKSASPCVTVSEDLKSVKAGEGWKVGPEHAKCFPCHGVIAEQAFSSGRQYWEVDVSQLPQWVLGIYTSYLRRKRRRNVDSFDSVFLLCFFKKEDDYCLQTYPGSLMHRVKGPVPRVGVFLEYTAGTLAFYNVLQHSLIYSFQSIPFAAPVSPIFSPGPPLQGTKAGPMILCPGDSHPCACCYSSREGS
ncbi:tripartite motif-containing protein 43B-like [Dromiciops gliroides]|uniref:tripartite motif-containing protein 43B-like n=1 Tax=Dromiciops gliroides TaxID=33562 RepID=UPI001CC4FAF0|nr:tripartite motif-containing protein 43B-like [Dromiciops gliroides]